MHTAQQKRRWGLRLLGAAAGCAMLLPGFSAAALPGFSKGRLDIVTEPERMSDLVTYYKDGAQADKSGMTWVDGRDGKALRLDGRSEYLQLGYRQLKTNRFSFAAWVNWLGAPGGADASAQLGQGLFTMARRTDRYLTFSPYMRDASKTRQGGGLNGIYLDYYFGGKSGQTGTRLEQYGAARDGVSYALPKNEWHHVTVVSDEQTMKVYIDGRLWFDDILLNSMVEMQALSFKVGSGLEGGFLHADLDDVGLYEIALSAEQAAMLAKGVDPLETGASLPPEESPYLPTRPAVSETPSFGAASGGNEKVPVTILGLPAVTVCIVGGLILVVAGLSVYLSFRPVGKKGPSSGKGGGVR